MRAAISPDKVVPSGPTTDLQSMFEQVRIGAAKGDVNAACLELIAHSFAVLDNLLLEFKECFFAR